MMVSEEQSRSYRTRSWLLGVIISAVSLVAVFWGVQPSRFLQAIETADYWLLLPAAALVFLGLVTRARSWHVLLGARVEFRRAFNALNEGYLLNNVFPLRLGEIGRAYLVSRGGAIRTGRALSSVLVERLIDGLITLAGLLVAIPFVARAAWSEGITWGAVAVLGIGTIGITLVARNTDPVLHFLQALPLRNVLNWKEAAGDFVAGLAIVHNPGVLLRAGFWSLAAWATTWIEIVLLLRMFGEQGTLVVALFVTAVTAFGSAVPSSPGALGVYELAMVAGLLAFGYPREPALGVALGAHGLHLLLTGVFGGWALAQDGQTVSDLAASVQSSFRREEQSLSQ